MFVQHYFSLRLRCDTPPFDMISLELSWGVKWMNRGVMSNDKGDFMEYSAVKEGFMSLVLTIL